MKSIEFGIYEALLDEDLRDAIARRPELRTVFGKIDPEEQPARYAAFVAKVVEKALKEELDPERRFQLCNRFLDHLFRENQGGRPGKHRLIADKKPVLLEITSCVRQVLQIRLGIVSCRFLFLFLRAALNSKPSEGPPRMGPPVTRRRRPVAIRLPTPPQTPAFCALLVNPYSGNDLPQANSHGFQLQALAPA